MAKRIESDADKQVRECLDKHQSFALIAGAGSGKTSSLVDALARIRETDGPRLRRNGQRIACITFTKRAVEVIRSRLGFDELYDVSTLHSFLWNQLGRFQEDIKDVLINDRVPTLIAKAKEKGAAGNSKDARDARARAETLTEELGQLGGLPGFRYVDSKFSNYLKGELSHDDVIEIAAFLLKNNKTFQRITALRFPYIFVDEAQDTFKGIVEGLNEVCTGEGLPIVGYFGDPWQQIYEGRASDFAPPPGCRTITKTENFRCSESVIRLLNEFRRDVKQYAAGENRGCEGSVAFHLLRSEAPEAPRNTYSEPQIDRALARMDDALSAWGWKDRDDVMKLFLARQMIARRLHFSDLNKLFTGRFASSNAEDAFEKGEHFLLAPFLSTICPLIAAWGEGVGHQIINILRRESPAFAVDGENASKSLKQMIEASQAAMDGLHQTWSTGTVRDLLRYCADGGLIRVSDRLREHLDREAHGEDFDPALHAENKGDWLADEFFAMAPKEIAAYARFVQENTPYSTQHGVKGEQYGRVLVLYDDVEAQWHHYSFRKLLTPGTSGEPTDGQLERSRKLAYVCFSRAEVDLRIILFTQEPEAARNELIKRYSIAPEQIVIDG